MQPNILFLLADDYGYHDIGYHGSEIKSQNLDELAAEGMKLENIQPICTPTWSQLLSGWYQVNKMVLTITTFWAYKLIYDINTIIKCGT